MTRLERAARFIAGGDYILCRGGRSGRKIHLAAGSGSSTTNCGLHLRTSAGRYFVNIRTLNERNEKSFCERCLPE